MTKGFAPTQHRDPPTILYWLELVRRDPDGEEWPDPMIPLLIPATKRDPDAMAHREAVVRFLAARKQGYAAAFLFTHDKNQCLAHLDIESFQDLDGGKAKRLH